MNMQDLSKNNPSYGLRMVAVPVIMRSEVCIPSP